MPTTTTPNMNLVLPDVSVEPGPQWASDLNTALDLVDAHDHTTGKGVPVPSAGLSINADLPFGNNDATTLRSTRFTSQGSPLSTAPDVDCVYVSGDNLYYNDNSGNKIQITSGGGLNPSAVPQATTTTFGTAKLGSVTPPAIGVGTAGTANGVVANANHTHTGLHQIQSDANPALTGDVVLASGVGVALTQTSQTITVSAQSGASGPVFAFYNFG